MTKQYLQFSAGCPSGSSSEYAKTIDVVIDSELAQDFVDAMMSYIQEMSREWVVLE